MTKITVTEALAEIKTIQKRILSKRESVMRYFARDGQVRDPLEGEVGGSAGFVSRERQAVGDLEQRIVRIRCEIQRSNLTNTLTVGEQARTVAEWLNWRREISDGQKGFLRTMTAALNDVRQRALKSGRQVKQGGEQKVELTEIVIAINERELAAENEKIEAVLGELDGKLSLANATTTIEV